RGGEILPEPARRQPHRQGGMIAHTSISKTTPCTVGWVSLIKGLPAVTDILLILRNPFDSSGKTPA
ncbi:hypothetical protein ABTK77_20355, partial [Acinetobacter baumannii]